MVIHLEERLCHNLAYIAILHLHCLRYLTQAYVYDRTLRWARIVYKQNM